MSIPLDPYAESVNPSVSCNDCEAVCCRLTVLLMPDDHVPEWLIDRDAHGMETLAKGEDGWCAAVDPNTSRCTIYEQRPAICRKAPRAIILQRKIKKYFVRDDGYLPL